MTTTVALAARDFIVVGCDSLATTTRFLVDPSTLAAEYFDAKGDLKIGVDGKPLLSHAAHLFGRAEAFPVDQLPSVTKIYDLKPFRAAALFAGAAMIGSVTVKNLVETFRDSDCFKGAKSKSMSDLAAAFRDHVEKVYQAEIPTESLRPLSEILLSGYSAKSLRPEVFRLKFQYLWAQQSFKADVIPEVKSGEYNVMFGGQFDVIQRVVNGLDLNSYWSLKARWTDALTKYHQNVQDELTKAGITYAITPPDLNKPEYDLFRNDLGGVTRLSSNVGGLSEQAGIDFVTFLIHTMIKAQEFSSSIPTVGGDIHLGLITARDGFQWISREEYKFQNHSIPKFKR